MFSECSESVKNFAEFRYREHNCFQLRPFFTNLDWKLIAEREQTNFKYKYIKIPWQCDDELEFVLPNSGTYSYKLLLQEIYHLAAVSGIMDRYLEVRPLDDDEDSWESSSESSNDEEEEEKLQEDPVYYEVNDMMEKNVLSRTEDETLKENRNHNKMAAMDFTKTITIGSGDSAKQKGTKVTLDDVCKANFLCLRLLHFGTREKETVWLLSIPMEEKRSVLLHWIFQS
jgi:hypothetical protein